MTHSSRSHRTVAVAGTLAMLVGAGLTSAFAGSADAALASRTGHRATTSLRGFLTAPATTQVAGTVIDQVSVRPRAHRVVRIQARRPGSKAFVTVDSRFSARNGDFRAVYRPTTAGTWHFRLFLPATATATQLVSPSRTITATAAKDSTAPGPVTAVTVVQGIGSRLTLSWTNPTVPDFAGVIIRRAVGSTAPATAAYGDAVRQTDATATSYTDQAPDGDTTYSYALFAVDGAGNKARAATATAVSGAVTTASLSLNGSTGATAKQTVNLNEAFDVTRTHAGRGLTLVSGTLDYGDGAEDSFTGDPATWAPAVHQYAHTASVTAKLTVVDSVGRTVSTSLDITVFDQPTATIKIDPESELGPGKPVTFVVTSDTPSGTRFTDFDTYSFDGTTFDNEVHRDGAPPATFSITFDKPGTYTVDVTGDNDAGGLAEASVRVVIVDQPKT